MKQVVIIGYGDIGQRVAGLWRARNIAVTGVRRKAHPDANADVIAADLDLAQSLAAVPTADSLVYYFAPPPRYGRTDLRVRAFLASLQANSQPEKIIYLSTSAVYGDRQGAVVTENTPPNPQTDRGYRRLAAENSMRAWGRQQRVPVVVLRVGGIYGPGRLPVDRIKTSTPVLHESLAPRTNRIHADDLAAVCVAAAERGRADRIYNVSDGQHSNMTQYFFAVADALGLPHPPEVDWDEARNHLSEGMLSYLSESRHMDITRLREELAVKLKYPNLEAGLAACIPQPEHALV